MTCITERLEVDPEADFLVYSQLPLVHAVGHASDLRREDAHPTEMERGKTMPPYPQFDIRPPCRARETYALHFIALLTSARKRNHIMLGV